MAFKQIQETSDNCEIVFPSTHWNGPLIIYYSFRDKCLYNIGSSPHMFSWKSECSRPNAKPLAPIRKQCYVPNIPKFQCFHLLLHSSIPQSKLHSVENYCLQFMYWKYIFLKLAYCVMLVINVLLQNGHVCYHICVIHAFNRVIREASLFDLSNFTLPIIFSNLVLNSCWSQIWSYPPTKYLTLKSRRLRIHHVVEIFSSALFPDFAIKHAYKPLRNSLRRVPSTIGKERSAPIHHFWSQMVLLAWTPSHSCQMYNRMSQFQIK